MLHIKIFTRFLILSALVLAYCSSADMAYEHALNPHTYTSHNKQFTLRVVPSDRRGFGKADYLLTQNGNPVLRRELPFTLTKAVVSDNGDIAGYSYSATDKDYKSQMHLWLLSRQGKVKLDRTYEQRQGGIDGPRLPLAHDIFIHPFNQTVTFSIYDQGNNPYWASYSLITGKEISAILTSFEAYKNRIIKLVTSEFNPYSLIAISHIVGKDESWRSNQEFCLLDKTWQKVECKTYFDEYFKKTPAPLWKKFNTEINSDRYLGFTKDNKFWVTSFKTTTKDFFAIRHSLLNHKVTLEKLDSKPFTLNAEVEPISKPARELVSLADRALPESILKNKESFTIVNMAFDEFNRKAAISHKDGGYYFERYDGNDRKSLSASLQINSDGLSFKDLIYYKNGQWILFMTRFDGQPKLILLSNKGEHIQEIKIDAPGAGHIVKSKNNEVFILAGKLNEGASLIKINIEAGDILRINKLKINNYDGLAITADQKIAVLGTVGGMIDFYSFSGEYLNSISLQKIANFKSSYFTDIQIDATGILYAFDFSSHQLISIKNDKLLGRFMLLRKDGKQLEHIHFMKFDLKNNLWVSNENGSVMKVDEAGKEVGYSRSSVAIKPNHINWMYVDKEENIFSFDNSQYLLSKIDKNGNVKSIYQTPADAQKLLTGIDQVIRKTQSGFLIKEKGKAVHIDENGNQLNDFHFECDRLCRDIIPYVHSTSYWREGFDEINIVVEEKHKNILSVKKDKNGNWLELIGRVHQNENDWLSFSSEKKLIAIDAFGKVQATFHLDDYSTAWSQVSNNFVYVTSYKSDLINVYSLSGELVASTRTQNTKFNTSASSVLYASGINKKLYAVSENSIKVYQLLEK